VVLSAVALSGLAALTVGALISSLSAPERSAPGAGAETPRTGTGSLPDEAEGPAIAGTISMAPELRERLKEGGTLFIIARNGPGPPFAVKRLAGPRFPLRYRLGAGDMMVAGTPFEGEVTVSARLSKTGAAGPAQPGDLEGEYPGVVAVGARGVDIVIARIH
jgi:cytochrome c-type biogenesis protein CcmH